MIAYQLLERARKAGMTVSVDGDRLRVRGPKRHADLVRQLLENKAVVIDLISPSRIPVCDDSKLSGGDETSPFSKETGVSSPLVSQKQEFEPVTADEVRFWIRLLREDGCRIRLVDGEPQIEWPEAMNTPGRRRDWQVNLATIREVLKVDEQPARKKSPIQWPKQTIPPPEIIADPIIRCPQCASGRVLRELREMTGGTCWTCWSQSRTI